jgi:uncharacterized paraquat-inducible protein A
MSKLFWRISWIIAVVASIIAAVCTLLSGGSIELAIIFLLLGASVPMQRVIILLSKKDDAMQTQIDTLTRELEEVKRKLEK